MTLESQRQANIARLEALGHLDPTCPSCLAEHYPWFREVWNGTTHTLPFAPPHKNRGCESGGRPHCTCDGCW